MKIEINDFIEKVTRLYLQEPGRVSSIAFWKTERFLRECETYEVRRCNTEYLYAIRGDQLIFYWSNQADSFLMPSEEISRLSFLVLHNDHYRLVQEYLDGFSTMPMYTLFYDFAFEDNRPLNEAYQIRDFNFSDHGEYQRAAELINATDAQYRLTGDKAREWTLSPAFDPTLWFWVVEKSTQVPIAIGVSNHCPKVRETDLDWIYVLPDHQGRGVGRMIIREIINRSRSKSSIIRLGGVADEFYMKCGFRRGDMWHVIRKV